LREEEYEVTIVIDDELRQREIESNRKFKKILAHRGLGYAHENRRYRKQPTFYE
jgi:hypothetical protein